eukprot:scaffold42059_cov67-Phaeocystis_antarctica.AAC.2
MGTSTDSERRRTPNSSPRGPENTCAGERCQGIQLYERSTAALSHQVFVKIAAILPRRAVCSPKPCPPHVRARPSHTHATGALLSSLAHLLSVRARGSSTMAGEAAGDGCGPEL